MPGSSPRRVLNRLGPVVLVFAGALLLARCGRDAGYETQGFERDTGGWILDGAVVRDVGAAAPEGVHVVELRPGGEGPAGFLRRALELEPYRVYRLSFAIQGARIAHRSQFPITLNGDDSLGVVHRVAFGRTPSAGRDPIENGWREVSCQLFSPVERNVLQIGPQREGFDEPGLGRIWIDAVAITPLDERRRIGAGLELAAWLPSEGVLGRPLRLHVLCFDPRGSLRTVGGVPTPMAWTGALELEGGGFELPERIRFEGEAVRSLEIVPSRAGIQRLVLRHESGLEIRSNPVVVTPEEPAVRHYWGDLHIHTNRNHGSWAARSVEQNYAFARDVARLDFAAVSEHFLPRPLETWFEGVAPVTLRFDEPGRFATLLAIEYSGPNGHYNHYLRGGDPLKMLDRTDASGARVDGVAAMRRLGGRFLAVPHHTMQLDPVDWRFADREVSTVSEIYSNHGSSEEAGAWWSHPDQLNASYADSMGAPGHAYRDALARGRPLGVIASSDTHAGRPGLTGLTCVKSPALEREAVWDALYERRCYATTQPRILIDWSVAGAPMGGTARLEAGEPLTGDLRVYACDAIERIDLVRDGEVIRSLAPGELDFEAEGIELGEFAGEATYVYARIHQRDEHRAWTSPVWVVPRDRADLEIEARDLRYDAATETLRVTVHNVGDADADAAVSLHSSRSVPGTGSLPPLRGDQVRCTLRVEPAGADRVRLLGNAYCPRNGRLYDYTGTIELRDARLIEIVHDASGAIRARADGRLEWETELGRNYEGSQCKSGESTDFELLIEPGAEAAAEIELRVQGVPPAAVATGRRVHEKPESVVLGLSNVHARSFADEREGRVPAGGETELEFTGLPAGETYTVVLDPEDRVPEIDERNNSEALLATGR